MLLAGCRVEVLADTGVCALGSVVFRDPVKTSKHGPEKFLSTLFVTIKGFSRSHRGANRAAYISYAE